MSFKKFFKEKKGIATLEFAILFMPFFLLLAALFETLLLIYQTSTIDYITSSAAQYASASEPDKGYKKQFEGYIESRQKDLLIFTTMDNLKISLEYCRTIGELEKGKCTGDNKNNKLIIYSIEYKVNPIFGFLRLISGESEKTISKVVYFSERSTYEHKDTKSKTKTS